MLTSPLLERDEVETKILEVEIKDIEREVCLLMKRTFFYLNIIFAFFLLE